MIVADIGASWRPASVRADVLRRSAWAALTPTQQAQALAWQQARRAESAQQAGWSDVPALDVRRCLPWGQAVPVSQQAAVAWNQVPARDVGLAPGWDQSITAKQVRLRLIYNPKPARKDVGSDQRFQRADEYGPRYDATQQQTASLYVPSLLAFAFAGARYSPSITPEVFFDFRYVAPTRAIQPVDSGATEAWGSARQLNRQLRLPWGRARLLDGRLTGITYPDYNGPVVIVDPPVEPDILETYMIANSVSLVVLPDRTPVDATGIKVSLDIDSFSWKFSGDLFGRTSLNLVRPDASGPKTLELTINGWVWTFLVERYSSTAKFPAERFSISGNSRSQLLAEPYAPKRSAVNAVDINARQAAEDQLEFTGFTLSWDVASLGPPDWTIPAGALSYQDQTAMQVIARVAEAVGAVVRPAREGDALTVLPRYCEAVWWWSSAIMDRIIPAEIITDSSGEWTPQPEWDSVYVSGTSHGVAVDVRRTGMAGNAPAPDVFDDLITATDAARSRGICEISKGGNQEIASRTIPLFPVGSAPGLVEPGMLCEVRDPGDTWRGLCLGVDISADGIGASRVSQVLRLERHHAGGA
ncbi:MAG TPA: hypothetical protein VJ047_18525 [Pseudomonas sp.]|nr:hypothetical protein [Pseudomonas sp.]